MSEKYQIWDKNTKIYTPSGAVFTPEEWMNQYSWINIPDAVPVVAGGKINGAFSGELSEMKKMYKNMGAVFEDGMSNQEVLDAIEMFEIAMNTRATHAEPSAQERIAAALEYQILLAE